MVLGSMLTLSLEPPHTCSSTSLLADTSDCSVTELRREAVLTRAASTGRPLCAAAAAPLGACGTACAGVLAVASGSALAGSGAAAAVLPSEARLCDAAGSSSQSWQLMACQQDVYERKECSVLVLHPLKTPGAGEGWGLHRRRAPNAYPERRLPVRPDVEGHGALHAAGSDLHTGTRRVCSPL